MTKPGQIFEIVRRSLEAGQAVEIEGLGRFHSSAGGYRFEPDAQPTVFMAYAVEDLAIVRRLCEALRAEGCSPWLDKDRLMPGQNWTRTIESAIAEADAFVTCFSSRSVTKRGQFQSELRYALACARKRPLDDVFLLPVRAGTGAWMPNRIAEECGSMSSICSRIVERGVKRLVRSIRRAARGRMRARFRPG